jgi:hypothetical protein
MSSRLIVAASIVMSAAVGAQNVQLADRGPAIYVALHTVRWVPGLPGGATFFASWQLPIDSHAAEGAYAASSQRHPRPGTP